MKAFLISASCALLVTACGGGNGDEKAADPTDSVPASASQSPSGFIEYLKQLVGFAPDDKEPVDVSAVDPQTADDAEPDAVPQ